ncbi:MAG: outer membrane beta-barrel protein [Rudaea sp.]
MNTISKFATTASLLVCAHAAFAQNTDSGWYVGIGAGSSGFSDNLPKQIAEAYAHSDQYTLTRARTTDDSDTAAQLFVGYKFLPWLAAEVGYQHLGEAHTHYDLKAINSPQSTPPSLNDVYRAHDINAALVASLPIGDQFELLARGGISNVSLSFRETGIDVFGKPYSVHGPDDDSTVAQFGIGAAWHFLPAFSLRLDLDRNFNVGRKFALHADTNGRFDNIDTYTLNLVWKP